MTEPSRHKRVLTVARTLDAQWLASLLSAVATLDGVLESVDHPGARQAQWRDYMMVVLDAGATSRVAQIVAEVRSESPEARVVVFSPSPDWREAKEVLLAGAIDYARKLPDQAHVTSVVKRALSTRVPSWPRRARLPGGGGQL